LAVALDAAAACALAHWGLGGWLARVASSSCVVGLYTYERLRVNDWAGLTTGLKLWPFQVLVHPRVKTETRART
jgi:hypothetical protein